MNSWVAKNLIWLAVSRIFVHWLDTKHLRFHSEKWYMLHNIYPLMPPILAHCLY